MTHHIDLSTIHLDKGATAHKGATHGCVMEWAARFSGVPETEVSDEPDCTSPVLRAFAVAFNDGLPDDARQRLIPFIPRLVGTSGDPEADSVRAWLAADWLVRVFTPTWLRKAGLAAEADALQALPELTTSELARSAQPIIAQAQEKAAAARAAAWAAARDAAGAAAGAAAWAAAWDAARDAAGAAAWAAAGAAAWAAAWDAARDAARDAAGAAAWDAAGAAAWAAASKKKGYAAQYDAAYKASRKVLDEALAETTRELTDSAFALFDRMIDGKAAVAA